MNRGTWIPMVSMMVIGALLIGFSLFYLFVMDSTYLAVAQLQADPSLIKREGEPAVLRQIVDRFPIETISAVSDDLLREDQLERLRREVSVEPGDVPGQFVVKVTSSDGGRAAEVANAVAAAYVDALNAEVSEEWDGVEQPNLARILFRSESPARAITPKPILGFVGLLMGVASLFGAGLFYRLLRMLPLPEPDAESGDASGRDIED